MRAIVLEKFGGLDSLVHPIATDAAAGRLDVKPVASSDSTKSAKRLASWRPMRQAGKGVVIHD